MSIPTLNLTWESLRSYKEVGNFYDRLAYIRIFMSTKSSKVDWPTVYEDTCVVPFHCSYPYWQPIHVFNSPLLCRQSYLCIKPKSSNPHPTKWMYLFFIFKQLYIFKEFQHCEVKVYGKVEVEQLWLYIELICHLCSPATVLVQKIFSVPIV